MTSSGGTDGISLNGMSGSLTVGTVDLDGQTGDGIDITNSPGTVTINGGTIGATNDPAGIGVDINGGTANVTINATVNKTTAGDIVEMSGRTGGTVDFNANLTSTNGGGIDLTDQHRRHHPLRRRHDPLHRRQRRVQRHRRRHHRRHRHHGATHRTTPSPPRPAPRSTSPTRRSAPTT